MEKISQTDHVKSKEVLLRVKEERNIVHRISRRKPVFEGGTQAEGV
jgi:antitoxin component of MazEF toxin-antitoxin module